MGTKLKMAPSVYALSLCFKPPCLIVSKIFINCLSTLTQQSIDTCLYFRQASLKELKNDRQIL